MAVHGLQRYKVLGAAHVLQEFTVQDLQRYAEVPQDTVRKVMARGDKPFFEALDRAPAKGRGSPPIRYRVNADKTAALSSLLNDLHRELAAVPAPNRPARAGRDEVRSPGEAGDIPASRVEFMSTGLDSAKTVIRVSLPSIDQADEPSVELLAAEHALLITYRKAGTQEARAAALQSAERDRQVDRERAPHRTARGGVVDALIELATLECAFERPPEGASTSWPTARILDAYMLAMAASARLGGEYAEEVSRWLALSPLRRYALFARPLIGAGRRVAWQPTGANFAPRRVELCYMKDAGERPLTIAEHVREAVRSAGLALEVRIGQALPTRAAGEEVLCLLTCDSDQARESALDSADRIRRLLPELCVLDASARPDFMRDVLRRGAGYVPYAAALDGRTLLRAVPALEAMLAPGAVTSTTDPCPVCGSPLAPGATACMGCGYLLRYGGEAGASSPNVDPNWASEVLLERTAGTGRGS